MKESFMGENYNETLQFKVAEALQNPEREEILQHVVLRIWIIMALAVFGNIFLAFIICRGNIATKRRISPVQLLLLHTCVADLLFAVFTLGTEVLIINGLPNFLPPDSICRLVRYLQVFPLYASPFLLVAINALALFAWLLALACSTPQLLIWSKRSHTQNHNIIPEGHELCLQNKEFEHFWKYMYVIWFNVIAWLLPSILLTFFYYKVCTTVWRSRKSLDNNNHSEEAKKLKSELSLTHSYVATLRNRSTGLKNQVSEFDRKKIQTVRLTLTIIVCNFLLWIPFCLINVFQAFAPGFIDDQLLIFLQILGNLNSCVNPWIYIIYNRHQLKRALMPLLKHFSPKAGEAYLPEFGTCQTMIRLTVNSKRAQSPHSSKTPNLSVSNSMDEAVYLPNKF